MSIEQHHAADPEYGRRHETALQLVHACQAYRYLRQLARHDQPDSLISEQALRGVRLVIFARFTDLVDSGNAPTGRLILANTLERPEPPDALHPAGEEQP